tara:strand:+ start:4671 stop:4784 length:114 start_codon:yes stop_codon:yes gene_type:complete
MKYSAGFQSALLPRDQFSGLLSISSIQISHGTEAATP